MSQITAIATTGGMGSVGTLTGDVGAAATPTASNINILGGSNIGTVTPGGGSDVTINLDDTVSISGSMTAGTGFTATTGDIKATAGSFVATAGNVKLPTTNSTFTQGAIYSSSNVVAHFYNYNTALGLGAGAGGFITTARDNTLIGGLAGERLTSGERNTLIGMAAGSYIDTGSSNVVVGGYWALGISSGNNNTLIGISAGASLSSSESYNVYLGQQVYGVLGESQTMRLGASDPGLNPITDTFIAGIYNTAIGATAGVVLIDSTHQLGSSNGSNGQVLVGGGTGPVWANITSTDTSVTITNGANTIDLSVAPSSSFTWNVETGASVNMAVNNGYIANRSAATLAALLPATAAVGDVVRVTGIDNATGWRITQNAGQTIHLGTSATTTGAAGYLESTAIRDSVELVCVIANTTWNALSVVGNITVA